MHSSGRIFNMVTSDVEMLQLLCQSIMGIVSSPLRIAIAMLLLYLQLGPAALVALAVLILMMPMQVPIPLLGLCQPSAKHPGFQNCRLKGQAGAWCMVGVHMK